MPFSGDEGNPIDPAKAASWTRSYREKNPKEVTAYFAGRQILEQLLSQPDSMGIRFYFGLDSGVLKLVAVSADSNENDQLGDGFIVADDFKSCPNCCSQSNILNS
jgi:hypothetical protein